MRSMTSLIVCRRSLRRTLSAAMPIDCCEQAVQQRPNLIDRDRARSAPSAQLGAQSTSRRMVARSFTRHRFVELWVFRLPVGHEQRCA